MANGPNGPIYQVDPDSWLKPVPKAPGPTPKTSPFQSPMNLFKWCVDQAAGDEHATSNYPNVPRVIGTSAFQLVDGNETAWAGNLTYVRRSEPTGSIFAGTLFAGGVAAQTQVRIPDLPGTLHRGSLISIEGQGIPAVYGELQNLGDWFEWPFAGKGGTGALMCHFGPLAGEDEPWALFLTPGYEGIQPH
jgi:hypothetical protein